MNKINWQNGTLVSKAKVEVGGTIYEVDPEVYSGSTPLSAENLNQMQDNIESAIKTEITTGQEFATNEYIDTKRVYGKRINCGDLPNNTTKQIAHGLNLSNITFAKPIEGYAIRPSTNTVINLPHISNVLSQAVSIDITGANINILTGTDRSTFTSSYVTVYYTKNT